MTRKGLLAIAASLAVAGLLFLILIDAVFCRATLHVPRRVGPTIPNSSLVTITAPDKVILRASWLLPPQSNGNCVAVLHGIGDSHVGSIGFAPMFLSQGYRVLVPDSRAHGTSGGELVTYGLLEKYDAVAWALWMKQAGCRKVYGLGESLGAAILIQAAGVQPIFAAIVAECPYADLREVAEYRIQKMGMPIVLAETVVGSAMLYARWTEGLDFRQASPVQSIAHAVTPILLIHGLNDDRTPPSNSQELANTNPRDALWLVPNAPHVGALRVAPEEFRRRVLGWFSEH